MEHAVALPEPEFKQQLPELNRTIVAATLGATPSEPSVIRGLQAKLADLIKKSDANAWQATVSLASYHSVFNENPFLGFSVTPYTQPLPGVRVSRYNHGDPPQENSIQS